VPHRREVFHEIGLSDPFGHAVAVLEARTYSPVARGVAEVSLCGDFAEVSLPVTDFARRAGFLGASGLRRRGEVAAPYPHLPLTSDYLDVSLSPLQVCERPMLVFRDPAMRARIARLREMGMALSAVVPGAAGRSQPCWKVRRHDAHAGSIRKLRIPCAAAVCPPSSCSGITARVRDGACGPSRTFRRIWLKRQYGADISSAG